MSDKSSQLVSFWLESAFMELIPNQVLLRLGKSVLVSFLLHEATNVYVFLVLGGRLMRSVNLRLY